MMLIIGWLATTKRVVVVVTTDICLIDDDNNYRRISNKRDYDEKVNKRWIGNGIKDQDQPVRKDIII